MLTTYLQQQAHRIEQSPLIQTAHRENIGWKIVKASETV